MGVSTYKPGHRLLSYSPFRPPRSQGTTSKPYFEAKGQSWARSRNHGTPLFHYLFPTVQGRPPAEPHGGPARLGPRASLQPHSWVVWPAPAPEAVSTHSPSDRALTFMHSPFENDHQPPRQPLMEAGDWRRCLCLKSSHGKVPRVETVFSFATETPRRRSGPRVVDPDQPLAAASVVAPEERPRWQHKAC